MTKNIIFIKTSHRVTNPGLLSLLYSMNRPSDSFPYSDSLVLLDRMHRLFFVNTWMPLIMMLST